MSELLHPDPNLLVGVDLGENPLAVVATPDGKILQRIEIPPQIKKYERRKNRLTLLIKHSQENSKRRQQKILQARYLCNKMENCYQNARYHFVKNLTMMAGYIVLEGLQPNTFTGQHDLLRFMRHKAAISGTKIIRIDDTYFPSSQLCHNCYPKEGRVKYGKPGTAEYKIGTCSRCGRTQDRDNNAAINIARKGLQIGLKRGILPSRFQSEPAG